MEFLSGCELSTKGQTTEENMFIRSNVVHSEVIFIKKIIVLPDSDCDMLALNK